MSLIEKISKWTKNLEDNMEKEDNLIRREPYVKIIIDSVNTIYKVENWNINLFPTLEETILEMKKSDIPFSIKPQKTEEFLYILALKSYIFVLSKKICTVKKLDFSNDGKKELQEFIDSAIPIYLETIYKHPKNILFEIERILKYYHNNFNKYYTCKDFTEINLKYFRMYLEKYNASLTVDQFLSKINKQEYLNVKRINLLKSDTIEDVQVLIRRDLNKDKFNPENILNTLEITQYDKMRYTKLMELLLSKSIQNQLKENKMWFRNYRYTVRLETNKKIHILINPVMIYTEDGKVQIKKESNNSILSTVTNYTLRNYLIYLGFEKNQILLIESLIKNSYDLRK